MREQVEVDRLSQVVNFASTVREGIPDTTGWRGGGTFTVKLMYDWWVSKDNASMNLSKFIWNPLAPPRVQCFGWLVCLGRVKTAEVLLNCEFFTMDEAMFCFCGEELESTDHLFLHCRRVWKIWSACLKWWGVCWVAPKSIYEVLMWWRDVRSSKLAGIVWKLIPLAVLWTVWRWRNGLIFNNVQPQWELAMDVVVRRTAIWAKNHAGLKEYSLHDLMVNTHAVIGMG